MVKLSRVGKLDGISSWSLEAGTTCPGSYKEDGSVVDACAGCYAKGGFYRFSQAKATRSHNFQDWKRDGWVEDMILLLDNHRYFRWFDSGDIHHRALAAKILAVCKATGWVKHWIPTRSYKISSISNVLTELQSLDNVTVRFSSDSVTGEYEEIHGSTIILGHDTDDPGLTVCQSHLFRNRCNGCRKCWDSKIKVIAYPAHGRSMIKLINEKVV